jgi:hypothetical protein
VGGENRRRIAASKTATTGHAMSPLHNSGDTTGTGGDAPNLAGDTPDYPDRTTGYSGGKMKSPARDERKFYRPGRDFDGLRATNPSHKWLGYYRRRRKCDGQDFPARISKSTDGTLLGLERANSKIGCK